MAFTPIGQKPADGPGLPTGRQNHEFEVLAEGAVQRVLVAVLLEPAGRLVLRRTPPAPLRRQRISVTWSASSIRHVPLNGMSKTWPSQLVLTWSLTLRSRVTVEPDLGRVAARAGLLPLAAEAHQPLVRRRRRAIEADRGAELRDRRAAPANAGSKRASTSHSIASARVLFASCSSAASASAVCFAPAWSAAIR